MKRAAVIIITTILLTATATLAKQPDSKNYSAICIVHVGISDKPIFPIVISDSKFGAKRCHEEIMKRHEGFHKNSKLILVSDFVIESTVMERMVSEIKSIPSALSTESGPVGTFSFIILKPKLIEVKVLDNGHTFETVERMKKYCGPGELFNALSTLQIPATLQ